jgi:two-component system, NtrC family, response regulator AtoC
MTEIMPAARSKSLIGEITRLTSGNQPVLTAGGNVTEAIQRAATRDSSVFISGESGTGKTRLARMIHQLSPRRDKPFVTVNCSNRSSVLLETELFSRSGEAEAGKLAAAADGILVLDEFEALPVLLQDRLFKAADERSFEPLGSNCRLPMRARFILIASIPFEDEAADGSIHAHLLCRHVARFHLSALRDRRTLIPLFVSQFLGEFCTPPLVGVVPEAMEILKAYDWPGNIRELFSVIQRAATLARAPLIQVDDLPEAIISRFNSVNAG